MNKLDHLPAELISLIVDHLDSKDLYACVLVSKAIFKATYPLVWNDVNIETHDDLTTWTTLLATSPNSPGEHIRNLSVRTSLDDNDLLTLMRYVPRLEHLRLQLAHNISDTSFEHLPRHCPHLTMLYIYHATITQVTMVALGKHCRQLRVIKFLMCKGLDGDLFDALRGCPLIGISLGWCGLDRIKTHAQETAEAASQFGDLTALRINDDGNDFTSFATMVWPYLTRVCLDECTELDDTMAIRFIRAHPQLELLELCHAQITDATLDAMADYLPNLTEVHVDNNPRLTAAGICRLVKNTSLDEEGVSCFRCDIRVDDDDFLAEDIDDQYYDVHRYEGDVVEMVWLSGNAFDEHDSSVDYDYFDDDGYSDDYYYEDESTGVVYRMTNLGGDFSGWRHDTRSTRNIPHEDDSDSDNSHEQL